MKMKSQFNKVTVIFLTLSILTLCAAQAGAPVTQARAAELALHRIENLVILKKIQPTHVARLKTLTLSPLTRAAEEDPAFQVIASQFPAADGSVSSITLPMRADGKALKPVESLGSDSITAPVWPGLDALTLAENALHCVQGEKLDNNRPQLCAVPEVAAYESSFNLLTLSQESTASGPIAVIDIRAQGNPKILRLRLKTDGVPIDDTPISFISE